MIRHSTLLLGVLLALALVWAPLPFGSVTPWADSLLRIVSGCALALAAASLPAAVRLRRALLPAALLVSVGLFGVVQALPLPAGVVGLVAPEHAALQRGAADLLRAESPLPARLSLSPQASLSAAVGWLALAGAFLAAAVAGHGRRERRLCLTAIVATGLFEVFFGARDWFSRSLTLWGVDLHASATRLRGTFVNPNHAALYLEIALAVVFAWGWWALRRAMATSQLERRVFLLAPAAIVWLLLFAGLAFTGSRAGLLAAIVAVSIQGLLMVRLRRRWWLAPLGAVVALLGLLVVAALGRQEGLGRLLQTTADDSSFDSRLREYRAVVDLWGHFPLTGSGLGTFRDAFPLVQGGGLPNTYWHPHSTLLEVPATTGLVGVALLTAALWLVVRRLLFGLKWGARSEDRASALAALGALISVGVHEAFDFGLTMPGTAFTFAVLVGSALTVKTEVKPRRGSEKGRRARQDLSAVGAGKLEHVQPAPHGDRDAERRAERDRGDGEGP